jgi:hypothetical protein
MNLSFAFLFLPRILCFRMFRVLAALLLASALVPAQAACLSTRESKPQDWYAWSNVLVAADVTGVTQRGRHDVLTLKVIETFKGPALLDTVTLEVPSNLWEACKLERPAVGARVLGAMNATNDANVVPLVVTYADELRALRPAPIAKAGDAEPAGAPATAAKESSPAVAMRCVEAPAYGASVKVETCEQVAGALFLRGEVLRAVQENSAAEVAGLPVPESGKRFLFFKANGQCEDYKTRNPTLTGRLSHPCCDAKHPYCARKTDFLIDEGPGATTPLR